MNPPLPAGPPPTNAFANLKAAAVAKLNVKPVVFAQAGAGAGAKGGAAVPIAASAAKKAAAAHTAAALKTTAAAKKPKSKGKAKKGTSTAGGGGGVGGLVGMLGLKTAKPKAKAKSKLKLKPKAKTKPPAQPHLKAAPMDEDADSDCAVADSFEHRFGEDLLGDETDRAYVSALDEDERELIMSERYEEREEAKDAWREQLAVQQKAKAASAAAAKKRKASETKNGDAAACGDVCVLVAPTADDSSAPPPRPPRLAPPTAAPITAEAKVAAAAASDTHKRRRTDPPPLPTVAAPATKAAKGKSAASSKAGGTKNTAAGTKNAKQSAAGKMFFMSTKDKQAQVKKKKASVKADAAAAASVAAAAAAAAGPPKKKKKPLLFMTPAERAEEKTRVQMERAQAKLKERLEENGAWDETLKTTLGDRAAPVLELMRTSSTASSSRKLIEGPPAPYPKDFEQHVRQLGSSSSSSSSSSSPAAGHTAGATGSVVEAAAAAAVAVAATSDVIAIKMRAARPARSSSAGGSSNRSRSTAEGTLRFMNLELAPCKGRSGHSNSGGGGEGRAAAPGTSASSSPKAAAKSKSKSNPNPATPQTTAQQKPSERPPPPRQPIDEAAMSKSERLLYKRHYQRCVQTPVGAEGESSLWADRYRPQRAEDVAGNVAVVGQLKTWMDLWKQRTARSEKKSGGGSSSRKRAKKAATRTSSGRPATMVLSSDDDFVVPDGYGDSDDSDDDGDSGLTNTKLLTGAAGIGKTATVYACAAELGYKVLEIHAGEKRSGSNLLAMLQEATQSHQVGSSKAAEHPTAASEAGAAAAEATPLRKGARVMVKWKGGTKHAAVIRKCHNNGSVDVDFDDDGAVGSNLTREEHGLVLLAKSPGPALKPAAGAKPGGAKIGTGKGGDGKGKRKAGGSSPELAPTTKKGFIYTTAGTAETPREIAKDLGVSVASLVKANAARYLGIKASSKLQKGTALVYHGEDAQSSRKSPRSSSAAAAAVTTAAAAAAAVPETPDAGSNGGVKLVEATVVLIEDIDTIFEEDRGFWAALESLIKSSKKPIVLTSTVHNPEIPLKSNFERLSFKRPSVESLLVHLRLLCKCEGIAASDPELRHVIRFFRRDVRKIFTSLEVLGKGSCGVGGGGAGGGAAASNGGGAAAAASAVCSRDAGMLLERLLGLGSFCVGEPALAKDVLAAATKVAKTRPAGLEAAADLLSYADSRDVDLLSATLHHLVVGRTTTGSNVTAAKEAPGISSSAPSSASSDIPGGAGGGGLATNAAARKVETMQSIVDDLAELDAAAELLSIRSSGDSKADPFPSVGSAACRRAMMECNYFAQLMAVGPGRHEQTKRLKSAISDDNLVHYNKQCIRLSNNPGGTALRTAVLGGGSSEGGEGCSAAGGGGGGIDGGVDAGERSVSSSSSVSTSSASASASATMPTDADEGEGAHGSAGASASVDVDSDGDGEDGDGDGAGAGAGAKDDGGGFQAYLPARSLGHVCTSNAATLLKTLKKAVAPSAKLRRTALGLDYLPFVRRIGYTESAREAAKVSRRFTHYLCSRGWSKRQITLLSDSLWESGRESRGSLLRYEGR